MAGVRGLELGNVVFQSAGPNRLISYNIFVPETFRENCERVNRRLGAGLAAVAKRHGISEQTIYTWRKRFGGFQSSDVRRLKQLETENTRLKKLVAERDRDRGHEGSRRKKLLSVPARRRQVAYGRERSLSARRACTLFNVARSALSYQGRKAMSGGRPASAAQAAEEAGDGRTTAATSAVRAESGLVLRLRVRSLC